MSTMRLEDFLSARGLQGHADVQQAFQDALRSLPLAALREAAGLTQKEIATQLGKSQAAVSKFEGRGDFLLSTLFQYVQALSGTVDLSISLGRSSFTLSPTEDDGDIYFRLAQKELAPAAAITKREGSVAYLWAQSQNLDSRQSTARRSGYSSMPNRAGYTQANEALTQLAANDEAEPIAA
ncbi:helix-turn-helix domain-containing protein [Xanthomonas sacchari]|uniref:helix-turn-helix domain-containing protein n=1 Tax=Xanthomonas sacchari TaxID=56458 RepID=UPI0035286E05